MMTHCTFNDLTSSAAHVVVVATLVSRAVAQPYLKTAFSRVKTEKVERAIFLFEAMPQNLDLGNSFALLADVFCKGVISKIH